MSLRHMEPQEASGKSHAEASTAERHPASLAYSVNVNGVEPTAIGALVHYPNHCFTQALHTSNVKKISEFLSQFQFPEEDRVSSLK